MRNIFKKSLFIVIGCLMAGATWADVIFSYTLTGTALGTYTATGGTAVLSGSSMSDNSVVDGKTFYKFNSSSKWTLTLANDDTFKEGDVLSFYCMCKDDKSGKGVKLNESIEVKSNFERNKPLSMEYTVVAGDAVVGKTSVEVKRLDSDVRINSFSVSRNLGPSKDATLKSLKYNGTDVPDFAPDKLSYSVEWDCTVKMLPVLEGETNHEKAKIDYVQVDGVPKTAKAIVTAEDGETKKEYTVSFTCISTEPKVESATWANILGTAVIDETNKTITGFVEYGKPLTVEPTFTGKHIDSWDPTGTQDFAAATKNTIKYTFTNSSTSETTPYQVTITEAPDKSSDASLKSLTYNGTSVPNFAATTYTYNVELEAGTTTVPTVAAVATDSKALPLEITQAPSLPGAATVKVTAENGISTLTYTINFTVAVPTTTLSLHTPGFYEDKNGYGQTLTFFKNRYYEVYYFSNQNSTSYFNAGASHLDSPAGYEIANTTTFNAGWLDVKVGELSGSSTLSTDEFKAKTHYAKVTKSHYIQMHVQGYDQFSFIGREASTKDNKFFQVTINGVVQSFKHSNSDNTVYRFEIPNGTEAIIEITGLTGDENRIRGFSLREAKTPILQFIDGDDSKQNILVLNELKPITYYLKNSQIADKEVKTELKWEGKEAKGITLTKNTAGDTLVVSGHANCEPGIYTYSIIATMDGEETSKVSGQFTVGTDIVMLSDTTVDAYIGETIEDIVIRYHALDADGIKIQWKDDKAPEGLTFKDDVINHRYIGSGVITAKEGFYHFTITIKGNEKTVITGKVEVLNSEAGDILFLYRTKSPVRGYSDDGVYKCLKDAGYTIATRTALDNSKRIEGFYKNYKAIVLSSDVSSDYSEVISILEGEANLPILNMQSYTYSRVFDGIWGVPDAGTRDTISNNNSNIYINHKEHPIYDSFTGKIHGDRIKVLDYTKLKKVSGIMPIDVRLEGTYCLATGYTRCKDLDVSPDSAFFKDGERQTIIHEIPASMRGGQKYISFPISHEGTKYLTDDGKKLFVNIMKYLLSPKAAEIELPTIAIKNFAIEDFYAEVDNINHRITLELTESQFNEMDSLRRVSPVITLADPEMTHVTPASKTTLNLESSVFLPYIFVVSDYITRYEYEFTVSLTPSQGIEQVYAEGDWVNIYDIYGRKVTTTNENIYTMDLPRGIYIAVTASGQTIKIMK